MDILKINKIHILHNKFGLTSFTLIRKITTVPLKWTNRSLNYLKKL